MAEQETGSPEKIGRRQQGITERRRRLVRAAGELIAEKENGNFSMPELAARAGVSLATPYNLFGSKAALLGQLFEGQVRGFHRDSDWMKDAAPLDRVLGVVDRLVAVYSKKPEFFRNLVKALYGLGSIEQSQFAYPAGAHLVHPLVEGLVRDGYIPQTVPRAVLEVTLTRLFDATFERWAFQGWDTEQLRLKLRAAFALVFYGLLAPADRLRMEETMRAGSTALPADADCPDPEAPEA